MRGRWLWFRLEKQISERFGSRIGSIWRRFCQSHGSEALREAVCLWMTFRCSTLATYWKFEKRLKHMILKSQKMMQLEASRLPAFLCDASLYYQSEASCEVTWSRAALPRCAVMCWEAAVPSHLEDGNMSTFGDTWVPKVIRSLLMLYDVLDVLMNLEIVFSFKSMRWAVDHSRSMSIHS